MRVSGTALLALLVASTGVPKAHATEARGTDVTQAVVRQTDLDERIAQACARHCKGNRRAGILRSVHVLSVGGGMHRVAARADLISRHDPGRDFGIPWSYTIRIAAFGTLNAATCMLTVERIRIANDRLGLAHLARKEEGKRHRIADCRRLLPR